MPVPNWPTSYPRVFNPWGYGVIGDGVHDDSAALAAALTAYLQIPMPRPPFWLPGGFVYYLNSTALPLLTSGCSIIGDGSNRSIVSIGPGYPAGFCFGWSEAWQEAAYPQNPPTNGTTLIPTNNVAGPCIKGVTIIGNLSNPNVVTALGFYDRNDHAVVEDVDVYYNNGMAISIGELANKTQGYMRESCFRNVKIIGSGTSTLPAVQINSTTTSGGDATNELDFYKLAVFAAQGPGVCIRKTDNNASATRSIRFFSLRVEKSGQVAASDNICVGGLSATSADPGQLESIHFFGLESLTFPAGANGFSITGPSAALAPYAISAYGCNVFSAAAATGINIQFGRLIIMDVPQLGVPAGSNELTFGASAGSTISIRSAGGAFSGWTILGKTTQSVT